MTAKLALSRLHFPIMSLGYGRRIGIWTQGCSIGCKGCMSVDTWASRPAKIPVAEFVTRVDRWLASPDGITPPAAHPLHPPPPPPSPLPPLPLPLKPPL